MLSEVLPINPLPSKIASQLQQVDDFFVCTKFTDDMVGPPIVSISENIYFRFMNFMYLPQPPESLTTEWVKKICDVRLEYFDELVNYQLNSSVVDVITDCVAEKVPNVIPSLKSSLKALDFGCGSGLSFQLLLKRIPNLDLIGVDISEKAISRCQKQGIRATLTPLGEPLPFADATFDLIVAVFVMHFNIDMQTIAELRRVLRPSGLFVFNVYQRDTDGLTERLEEAGFCSIGVWQRLSIIGNNHVVMNCSASPT